ncbi:MAG TPA: class I SAM-dependent methyltransferase [Propionibacteriaceae bacterium]|nr:class I SAM-dependent methyltransferase [Propionibacteriaceae bacterium]
MTDQAGARGAEEADSGNESGRRTAGRDYAERLVRLETARWKRVLDVQRPYRWNLRRLELGRCLDVGCGIGRNLVNLGPGAVGVDHNADAIEVCRERGLTAYTTEEFMASDMAAGGFDSLLIAHVLEHVSQDVGDGLLRDYLPYLRPHAKVVVITPQEAGFASDATHIRFVDHAGVAAHAERVGLTVERTYSFPFPRIVGKVFPYNEFVTVLRTA